MVKLSPLCWLAALRGAGGALGCFRFHANLVAPLCLPGVGAVGVGHGEPHGRFPDLSRSGRVFEV